MIADEIVERRWGTYKVLGSTEGMLVKKLTVWANHSLSLQKHDHRSECWFITKGKGYVYNKGRMQPVQTGDIILVGIKSLHKITAIEEIELLEVQCGTLISEEDITRFEDYNEIDTSDLGVSDDNDG